MKISIADILKQPNKDLIVKIVIIEKIPTYFGIQKLSKRKQNVNYLACTILSEIDNKINLVAAGMESYQLINPDAEQIAKCNDVSSTEILLKKLISKEAIDDDQIH